MRNLTKGFVYLIVIAFYVSNMNAQNLLKSGPMVGYSTMREVCIWVQTTSQAKVKFEYWNINDAKKKFFSKSSEKLLTGVGGFDIMYKRY